MGRKAVYRADRAAAARDYREQLGPGTTVLTGASSYTGGTTDSRH
ncbi:hypothetical protein [Mesorhizobium tamadayense]